MQRDVGNGSRRNADFAHAGEEPIREPLVARRRITHVESDDRPRWQSVKQEGRVGALAASHRGRTAWQGDDNQRYPKYRAVQAPPRFWLGFTLSSRLVIWNLLDGDAVVYTSFHCTGQTRRPASVSRYRECVLTDQLSCLRRPTDQVTRVQDARPRAGRFRLLTFLRTT